MLGISSGAQSALDPYLAFLCIKALFGILDFHLVLFLEGLLYETLQHCTSNLCMCCEKTRKSSSHESHTSWIIQHKISLEWYDMLKFDDGDNDDDDGRRIAR
jgi:hypothetical protein